MISSEAVHASVADDLPPEAARSVECARAVDPIPVAAGWGTCSNRMTTLISWPGHRTSSSHSWLPQERNANLDPVCVHQCTIPYNFDMSTMSASEARAALPEILDRVLVGEEVTITRHGAAVAVVVRPDSLRARRADEALAGAEQLRQLVSAGRLRRLDSMPTVTAARADQLVEDVRAARARR